MRILILGAGGIGGYFGGRIQAAGGDVTYLVRPQRSARLKASGLRVVSPFGDLQLTPKLWSAEQPGGFDVVIVSCKAYDLPSAIEAIAPAVGPQTLVLPLLNGIAHMDALDARFGRERVLGGVAQISVTLGADGEILHLNKMHRMIVGARPGTPAPVLPELARLCGSAGFDFSLSENIEQSLWDKVAFLAALAGATCTLRASVGVILETVAGEDFLNGLLAECSAVAEACGRPLGPVQRENFSRMLNEKGSALVASMLRDVERGGPTEADHILGDLVGRAQQYRIEAPRLRLAYSHLQAYALRRQAGA